MIHIVDNIEEKEDLLLLRGDIVITTRNYISNHQHLSQIDKKESRYVDFFLYRSSVCFTEYCPDTGEHFTTSVTAECWEKLKQEYSKAGFKIKDIGFII